MRALYVRVPVAVHALRVGVDAHTRRWGPCSDPSLSISFLSAGHSRRAAAATVGTRAARRGDGGTVRQRGRARGSNGGVVAEEFLFVREARLALLARKACNDVPAFTIRTALFPRRRGGAGARGRGDAGAGARALTKRGGCARALIARRLSPGEGGGRARARANFVIVIARNYRRAGLPITSHATRREAADQAPPLPPPGELYFVT